MNNGPKQMDSGISFSWAVAVAIDCISILLRRSLVNVTKESPEICARNQSVPLTCEQTFSAIARICLHGENDEKTLPLDFQGKL